MIQISNIIKNFIRILWMIFVFKCFCSWFQYPVGLLKVEQFLYDHIVMPKSKGYYWIFELNSINDSKFKYNKKLDLNIMNDFCIQMFLQLISIPGWLNKSWTISVWPFPDAKIKGVELNIWIKFHKWFKI